MKRGGGARVPTRKGAPLQTIKRSDTTAKGSQPQVERLKSIEQQQLQEFLGGSDPAQSDHASGSQRSADGMEEKIGNIERMIGKLNNIVQKTKGDTVASTAPDSSKVVNLRVSSEVAPTMDCVDISEEPKQARRRAYNPINVSESRGSSHS